MASSAQPERAYKVVVVGHVDHGKSTLLGRLMLDCGKVPDDKVAYVDKICKDKAVPFEPAFLFDALQEEQEQGISIDTTRVYFEFEGKKFILIDAPGHLEFLKNMTSGASEADLGILVVDCSQGVRSQTERHLKVLSILGVRNVVVALNKIDKFNYDQKVFEEVCTKTRETVETLGLGLESIVPLSALLGENILSPSTNMDWYLGKPLLPTVLGTLEKLIGGAAPHEGPFRMVLQDVYRFERERYFAGRVLSGSIRPGMEIVFSPSGKMSTVASVEKYPQGQIAEARAGDSVALQLTEQVFVERGEIISLPGEAPEVDNEFRGRFVWLSKQEYSADSEYLIKIGTNEALCKVELSSQQEVVTQESVQNGVFVDAVVMTAKPLAFDRAARGTNLDKFVICNKYETIAAGVIDRSAVRSERSIRVNPNLILEQGYVERQRHELRNGHKGAVLWFTGLSGAGKSTLAKQLEKVLFQLGARVVVLDGDNLRHGLCADLGFSPEERSENIRRIAHTARILLDTGTVVITACISPYERDREQARQIVGSDDFNEIFVFCPVEECQRRDPKGLYKKANAGTVKSLTGVDSPYQPPRAPAVRLDSSLRTVSEEVEEVLKLLVGKRVIPEAFFQSQSSQAGLGVLEDSAAKSFQAS